MSANVRVTPAAAMRSHVELGQVEQTEGIEGVGNIQGVSQQVLHSEGDEGNLQEGLDWNRGRLFLLL